MSPFSERIITKLAGARHITVLTGAGASAESGIPTFRDPDGLWSKFDPMEIATHRAFVNNPVRVQSWYSARIKAGANVNPNPCHRAIAELEDLVDSVVVVTQNVDGLHQRAGSTDVVELHGSIHRIYCVACSRPAPSLDVEPDADEPAKCECGGLLRPDVVWFGEMLPSAAHARAVDASAKADVFLSIGTSAEVYPAAGLPLIAAENGATVIEINLNRTPLSDVVDASIRGPAGELMPLLVASVREKLGSGVVRT